MTEFEDPRVEELDSDDEVVESKVAVPDEDEVTNISYHNIRQHYIDNYIVVYLNIRKKVQQEVKRKQEKLY